MNSIKILVADDHAVVREGICQIIKGQKDMEVVDTAEDGLDAIEKAKSLKPDVLLMDVAMPNLTGLEAVNMLKDDLPDTGIVMLSMHAKETFVHQALKSGALGYVLKDSPSQDIVDAIHAAYRKEYFLSSRIKADVIDIYLKNKAIKPTVRGYDLLTEREQQVFRLIVEGKSAKEIAGLLFVSAKTIDKHRANIMNKLGVHGRLELLKYAIKIGIVDPELW